ncbi:MAG TPA: carboxypeptidase-like regulatory domain-containing protein, partial [Thermoanaerobaculia bacterium]|nr:carboxypeptidase-like regulatory domain-containing protein [Thermoanaerobaculia bacterium]
MKHNAALALILLVFSAPGVLLAQANGGELEGIVNDPAHRPLAGARVTATENTTGFSRAVIAQSGGAYRFASLPAGTYNVTAALRGFITLTTRKVGVLLSRKSTVDFELRSTDVEEEVTVTAHMSLIETSASVQMVMGERDVSSMPLASRQLAEVASLAPGTTLSVNADPTKPGQLTIALNGGSGRNVDFLVDGGDNTDDTIGGALQNFNIEAVQEFNIQTQQYKAEFGRTTGGVLTVVTKTGTNTFEGSGYEFFRDKSLNSESESEKLAGSGKAPYRRDQYGASLGGPIVKDRAHFFVTAERRKDNTNYILDSGGIYPNLDGQAVPTPFKDELMTAKASTDINAKQFLQVRYGMQRNSQKYGASPIIMPSALGTISNSYHSILLGHTWQISSDKLNDALIQDTHFKNFISPDSNDPAIVYPNGTSIGQSINTPQSTVQVKRQFKDDFSWSQTLGAMRHDFKVGANYVDEPILGGDFSVGTTGQYTLTQ